MCGPRPSGVVPARAQNSSRALLYRCFSNSHLPVFMDKGDHSTTSQLHSSFPEITVELRGRKRHLVPAFVVASSAVRTYVRQWNGMVHLSFRFGRRSVWWKEGLTLSHFSLEIAGSKVRKLQLKGRRVTVGWVPLDGEIHSDSILTLQCVHHEGRTV